MSNLTEIRWHGRGGQGAKTAALLLADVAFQTGKYVQGFPEYGPERMGAPINFFDYGFYDVNIRASEVAFFDCASFVEWEVEEVYVFRAYAHKAACSFGFATAEKTFEHAYVECVDVVFAFFFEEEFANFVVFSDNCFVFRVEHIGETFDECDETDDFVVANGNVARCFVANVNFVTLVDEAFESAAHRDYVVVGVRREYDDAFREWVCTFGTVGVVGIWFSSRPSGDGVLEVVEYFDVYVIG